MCFKVRRSGLAIVLSVAVAGSLSAQRVTMAKRHDADRLLSRRAMLHVDKVPLETGLTKLYHASGVPLAFNPGFLPPSARVSCRCQRATVAEALDSLLVGTGLQYVELGAQVVIERRPPMSRLPGEFELQSELGPAQTALASSLRAPPQAGPIAGTVTDTRGRAIAGARVGIEGQATEASTDGAGRFRFEQVQGGEVTLRVVAIGYRPLTRLARVGDTGLELALAEIAINLDELVVTGTAAGASERRAIGNSVAKIDVAKLTEIAPVTDVGQLITGRAPGAVVQLGSGAIGSGPRIKIRGHQSLALNDQPLVYVDGIRVDNTVGAGPGSQGSNRGVISRLNDFSPEDIESIEVIKGPAAATLYGTEASNGVIQIITKRGKSGTGADWSVSLRQGAAWFANPGGRIRSAWGRDPQGRVFSVNAWQLEQDAGRDVFRTGHLQGYGLNVSGGTDRFQYYVGADFDRDTGIERNNDLSNYGTRANFTAVPSEKLKVNANVGYVWGTTNLPSEGVFGGTIFALQWFNPALLGTPREGWEFGTPLAWQEAYHFAQSMDRFTGGLQFEHRPATWFSQRLTLGLDQLHEENVDYRPRNDTLIAQFGAVNAAGLKNTGTRGFTSHTVDYSGTATASPSDAVRLQTSIGLQYYNRRESFFAASGRGFPAPGLSSISATALTSVSADTRVENTTVGVYLQQQVSLRDRLYLTGAIRADDNSAFGENFDFVTYPKASLTWVASEEPFWKLGFVPTLRLRAAYGRSGQQPGAFDAVRSYQPQTGGGGIPVLSPKSIGNPDLAPERGEEIELGFDAGLWNDRLGIEFTYYWERTRDALLLRDLPPSLGYVGGQFVNVGELRNKGIELGIRARAIESRSVDFDLNFNLGTNANQIVSIGDVAGGLGYITLVGGATGTTGSTGHQRHQEGHSAGAWFGRKLVAAQVDADANVLSASCDDGQGGAVDCASAPVVFLAHSTPRVSGSFTPSLTLFKRIRFHAMLDFQTGHSIRDDDLGGQCIDLNACRQLFAPGDFDPVEVAAARLAIEPFFGLMDGSFAKLREAAVSVTLPARWVRALGVKAASLVVAGRNLKTWTGFDGLDPELFLNNRQFAASNITITPPLTQVVTRVNITF